MNFHVVSRGVAFNFDFPVGEGHVNMVDYSYKGTASILFDIPKCRWPLSPDPLQSILSSVTNF